MLDLLYFFTAVMDMPQIALPLLGVAFYYYLYNPPKELDMKRELFLPGLFITIGVVAHSPPDISAGVLLSAYTVVKALAIAMREN